MRIRAIHRMGESLTELQAVERGLLLSKRLPADCDIAKAMIYASARGNRHPIEQQTISTLLKSPDLLRNWWEDCSEARSRFRRRLASRKFGANLKALNRDLLVTTEIGEDGTLLHRYHPMTVDAACRWVLLKLRRPEIRKRLRQCPECNGHFLVNTMGRPRIYCTAECQEAADQKAALKRQATPEQRKRQRQRRRNQR